MNPIIKFFHELMNPHCEHCIQERLNELERLDNVRIDSTYCKSCESLKMQLSIVNQQNQSLINKLVDTKTEPTSTVSMSEIKPLQTRMIPWNVKRQQLEEESRNKANALKNAAIPDSPVKPEIKKLEDEILLGKANAGT